MTRLKELRKSLNLTQSEFAEKIGMAQQGVSMAENGTRELTDRQIITICAVFGISEEWLRTGEGDMYPLPPSEDVEIIELLGELAGDDMDPRKKRMITSMCRFTMNLSAEELTTLKTFFDTLSAALDEKNSED